MPRHSFRKPVLPLIAALQVLEQTALNMGIDLAEHARRIPTVRLLRHALNCRFNSSIGNGIGLKRW
jgi:hypothetical protein